MTPRDIPESLAEVAATGNRQATLEALRDLLAEAIEAGPPARDLAALSRRLLEVLDQLEYYGITDDDLVALLSEPSRTDDPSDE